MQWRVLLVLMWKHMMVRLKRWFHTPVELISPIMFFLMVILVKSGLDALDRIPDDDDDPTIGYTDTLNLNAVSPPLRILYSPINRHTDMLMDIVGANLRMNRTASVLSHLFKGYYGLYNQSIMDKFISNIVDSDSIVLFHNLGGARLPDQLNYTIRMGSTKDFFANGETKSSRHRTEERHAQFGLVYEKFMRLQWAIDTSYIKVLTGKEVTQNAWLQEFPFFKVDNMDEFTEIKLTAIWILCFMSLFIVFVSLMSRLLEERASGVQELIKMMGVSSELLGISHFLNVLPAGLMFSCGITIMLKIKSYPLSLMSDGSLIWIVLFLHFVSVISMAFPFSYLITNTNYIVSLSVLVYVGAWMPTVIDYDDSFLTLLPHRPLMVFWFTVLEQEGRGVPLTYSDINVKLTEFGTVLWAIVCLLIQIAFFFLLAWYLSRVRPGKYGQAAPWNFLFQREYWTKNEVKPTVAEEEEEVYPVKEDAKLYFQPAPKDMEAGIKIENVSKVFPRQIALNKVTMDVYKGEITVLVGHNGAGKTTLMSIITGMMSASSGRVLVNGLDTSHHQSRVRKQLGLCPQHNLFFSDLNVQEHIIFFALLKGATVKEAKAQSRELLSSLDITSKATNSPSQLSGGMKRRLQLACALSGEASVLVLDEPTSGLDVETRKGLWDLLLSLRGSRTVLLTTHFMEEADALGDRVAAMHHGRLRAHATPMHLKKAIGTGYRLTFTTAGLPNEGAITSAVTSHVPEAALKDKTINSLTYNLPAASSNKFPQLFAALEAQKKNLGIETIGVGVSTLDDVFLKLCSDVDTSFTEDEVDSAAPVMTLEKSTGWKLYLRQFWYLLKRQYYYAMDKKISFLALQVVLPIIMICAIMHKISINFMGEEPSRLSSIDVDLGLFSSRADRRVLRQVELGDVNMRTVLDDQYPGVTFIDTTNITEEEPSRLSSIDVDLGLFSSRADRRVLRQVELGDVNMRTVLDDQYPGVTFIDTSNITEVIIQAGKKKPSEYGKYLAGLEINETDVKILYTTVTRHTAPVALNLATNILTSRSTSRSSSIKTRLYPLDNPTVQKLKEEVAPRDVSVVVMWGAMLVFIIQSAYVNFVALPCQERLAGTRHIHVMSGCPVPLHWLATLAFHMAVATAALILPAILACLFLDPDKSFTASDFLGALFLTLFLSSLAFLAFTYCVSFMLGQRGASLVLIAVLVIFGLVTPLTSLAKQVLDKVTENKNTGWLDRFLKLALYTMPPQASSLAVIKTGYIATINGACEMNRDICPAITYTNPGFDVDKCCAGEKMGCYLCKYAYSPWKELIILTIQFFVYMTLVVLSEMGLLAYLREKTVGFVARQIAPLERSVNRHDGADLVEAEAQYVHQQIRLPKKELVESNNAMLFNNLHKKYVRLLGKNMSAVRGISLSVKKGECFGLLGVNGAGKSTTFKMLTAEEWPSAGRIYANGHFRGDWPLSTQHFKYLNSLGYCPQFSGVDSFMTGRQNLELLLVMRGFHKQDLKSEVDYWIKVVGLEKYSARAVSGYSGGCARRLAAAAALCAGARVALLDEPTAGVDVAARRRVWAALRRGLKRHQAIVISSHSMEEIEALCARIAIMSHGGVRVVGTPGELRALYAGHAVLIKLAPADEVDAPATANEVDQLKSRMQSHFTCTLKDEHRTVLHYHLTDTKPYSEIFTALEALRESFPHLVEDYSVTETTLEEVFISIAKEEQHVSQPARNNIV